MRAFACDHHELPLPPGHPFPVTKYRRLRETLIERQVLSTESIAQASLATVGALERVHSPEHVQRVLTGRLSPEQVRRIGFPWSEALVRRSLASVGGTLDAARAALTDGLAGNLAGGTHHAHRSFGAGYCVFNDLAVAARALLDEGRVARVLVLDVDVHQGDGTAALFADEPRVFTCSLHGARNFPARKATSDLDVALPDGADDATYLAGLRLALDACLSAHADAPFGLALYQGGVDPLADDHLGRMKVTARGLEERDRLAIGALRAAELPVALTLGGGYARPIEASIDAHVTTYRVARELAG